MAFLQDSQPDLCLLAKSGGCSVYQLRNESGEGTMTVYEVFPGATILYNDFHMAYCDSSFETQQDLLCIDYCREGRMEYAVGNDAFSYVEAGDLKVDRRLKHKGYFSLPLSHYHGISMCFDLSMIPMELARLAGDYPLDLAAIQRKFCPDARPRVIHGAPSVDHIFQELCTVPERIKMPYFRVKILELLLYLDALELGRNGKTIFLPFPGGNGKGHPLLSGGASGSAYHVGGSVQTVPDPFDHHEGLLQKCIWQSGEHLYAGTADGSGGSAASERTGGQRYRDRRSGGL